MKKQIIVILKKTIDHCANECPYFKLDGGPGPIMYCSHPSFDSSSYDGYIISHPECDTGFPKKCPLFKKI